MPATESSWPGNKRYREAVEYYRRGLDITEKYQLYFYGYGIYQELAEVYSAMGEHDRAVEYLSMYYDLRTGSSMSRKNAPSTALSVSMRGRRTPMSFSTGMCSS